MKFEIWLLFIAVWSATTMPIGPNVINCVSISSKQGFKHSLWTVPGIGLAAMLHISIGLTGLAALLVANPVLFDIIRYAGASYMLYMAYKMWRDKGMKLENTEIKATTALSVFRQAFLISFSNPKAILVNVAIFSQFIDTGIALLPQLFILLPTALIIDAAIYGGYCGLGTGIGKLLGKPKQQQLFSKVIAVFYFAISIGFLTYDPASTKAK
ncbi:LysE family translocator [Curvivirga sp.]|uniref:LysE family translocator n=1 Tax=Curvivirga sp. TaxID=2856848 RepID=UPI003B5BDD93